MNDTLRDLYPSIEPYETGVLEVSGGHRLVAPVHHPGVGVTRPGVQRGLDRGGGRVEVGHDK